MIDKLTLSIEESLGDSLINLLKALFNGLVQSSFWICLIVCMISLLLYVGGQRKAGKGISISIILYILFQALKAGFDL